MCPKDEEVGVPDTEDENNAREDDATNDGFFLERHIDAPHCRRNEVFPHDDAEEEVRCVEGNIALHERTKNGIDHDKFP